MVQRAKTSDRGYGWNHQQARQRWARLVAAGLADCARCGEPIIPGEPWDLGHDDDDRGRYRRSAITPDWRPGDGTLAQVSLLTRRTGTRQPNAIPEKTARPLAPRPESGSLLSNT
jgi:hypothetical protein